MEAAVVSGLVLEKVWSTPLAGVSLELRGGVCVVVGDEADGTGELALLCAGVRAPRRGRVALDGRAPFASPTCRRGIASLLPDETLPPGLDVRGWLAPLEGLIGVSAAAVLDDAALEPTRALTDLTSAERRSLALALALAHPRPRLVVLHDPLASGDADVRQRTLSRITELGRSSAVLVTTPALADARRIAGSVYRLDRGLLTPAPQAAWPGGTNAGGAVVIDIEADEPRALLAMLALAPAITELRFDEIHGLISARGTELEPLANAIARAAIDARTTLRLLRPQTDDLEAARALHTGSLHAAYAASRNRAQSGVITRSSEGGSRER
jgi:ABC-type thiamine transport system ATPase subunit